MKQHSDLDLPPELEGLADLALDLRWTVRQTTDRVWELLDPETWEKTKNPYLILQNISKRRLKELARDETLIDEIKTWQEKNAKFFSESGWCEKHYSVNSVAYFSMEFGLSEALPIYSGGLGILAGDHLKTASDLGVPLVGVGLLYQQGYFRQVLAQDGSQVEAFPYNDPSSLPLTPVWDNDGGRLRVKISLPGRNLFLRIWKAKVGRVSLFLLDSNDPMNSPWDRAITASLYASGQELRLIQEIVLGIGGWQALEKMEIQPEVCHMNEGHAAFVVLARACSFMEKAGCSFSVALWATRAGNVFTTHTPVEAGFDRFDRDLLRKYISHYIEAHSLSQDSLASIGVRTGKDDKSPFNIALLALNGSGFINGVSRLHGQVSKRIFQSSFPRWPEDEVPVGYVTNGVHIPTWDSPAAQSLWSRNCPGKFGPDWIDYEEAGCMALVSDQEIWSFRALARKDLINYVRRRHVRQVQERGAAPEEIEAARHVLDPNTLTIGFARRATAYKRTNLLLRDEERMIRILTNHVRPVQLLMAAKAHPADNAGKGMVKQMASFASRQDISSRVVFLEDYDIDLAQHLEAGVDLWINTPVRPNEACGTSGMKVLANGGLNLSTLDGWWDEAYSPQVGWLIGDGTEAAGASASGPKRDDKDAQNLYRLLEEEVIPLFYNRDESGIPVSWIARIKASMVELTPRYSSSRMMKEYLEKVYKPAAEAYRRRAAEGAKLAQELLLWQKRLARSWGCIRFGNLKVAQEQDSWHFQVEVYLGDVSSQDVHAEIYADPLPHPRQGEDGWPVKILMDQMEPLTGAVNGFIYSAIAPASRPAEDYTPRVVPYHPLAFVPLEEAHILWMR